MSTYNDPATMSTTTSTIDISSFALPSYTFYTSTASSSNYSIGAIGSNGSVLTSTGLNGSSWSSSSAAGLHVTSNASFDGDVKIKGVSITKVLESIQDRLAILVPDPEKLEKYAALKKAYDHYKTMERLIGED